MLTQEYLKEHGLEQLQSELGIKTTYHDDGRVILNYDQINSPKTNEIVRECRGLTLDSKDWSLVARSFPRFFNLGEYLEEQQTFKWGQSVSLDKEDGSLLLLYNWQNAWHINTRGSFGQGLCPSNKMTWRELFLSSMPEGWERTLDPLLTYVCELCSVHNKIVRQYPQTTTYLLSIFAEEDELSFDETYWVGLQTGFAKPTSYVFKNSNEVIQHITEISKEDATYEGIVVRDVNGQRIKVKSPLYVSLHSLASNGNIGLTKNLARLILAGEQDETLTYFPELESDLYQLEDRIDQKFLEVQHKWAFSKDLEEQKEFALAIKGSPLSPYLFRARQQQTDPVTLIREDPNYLIKVLIQEEKR